MIQNINTMGPGDGKQNKILFPISTRIILLLTQIVLQAGVDMDNNEKNCHIERHTGLGSRKMLRSVINDLNNYMVLGPGLSTVWGTSDNKLLGNFLPRRNTDHSHCVRTGQVLDSIRNQQTYSRFHTPSSLFAVDTQVKLFLCRPGQTLQAPGGCGS
jgi:hypothetical protein